MIYFVLPVYNEQENLKALIGGLRLHMKGQPYRIITVNDGSSDDSLKILKMLRSDDFEIIGSEINMNVGAVFNSGISRVLETAQDDDIMIIMESDRTSDIKVVDDMVEKIRQEGQDIAIASRYQRGGSYKSFPVLRMIFSFGASFLMRHFFPIQGVCDYTIFFRAYRAGVVRRAAQYFGAFGLIQSKGFVANAELLIKLSLFTKKITEIPFVYDYAQKKGVSKIHILRTINEYFVLINYINRVFKKVYDLENRKKARGSLL